MAEWLASECWWLWDSFEWSSTLLVDGTSELSSFNCRGIIFDSRWISWWLLSTNIIGLFDQMFFFFFKPNSFIYKALTPSGMITANAVPTRRPAPRTVTYRILLFKWENKLLALIQRIIRGKILTSDKLKAKGTSPDKYEPRNMAILNIYNITDSDMMYSKQ